MSVGNTEASFVFASLTEFFNVWRSGMEASFSVYCKEGRASLSFTCGLGHPDQRHINPQHLLRSRYYYEETQSEKITQQSLM